MAVFVREGADGRRCVWDCCYCQPWLCTILPTVRLLISLDCWQNYFAGWALCLLCDLVSRLSLHPVLYHSLSLSLMYC